MAIDLVPLLTSCRTHLPTESAQRRWGRGIDYFLERCGSRAGPERVELARDILQYLTEPYGLARASEMRQRPLGDAVNALKAECERTVREDPAPLYAWGVIAEHDARQAPDLKSFIALADSLEPASGGTFTFNAVILLAGDLVKPEWTGVGRLYLSEGQRMASLKMFPPPEVFGADLSAFLITSIATGLDRTDDRIRRKHLAWQSGPHRRLLADLR